MTSGSRDNVKFVEMPLSDFPMEINVHDPETGALVDSTVVTGPGSLKVKGYGRAMRIVVKYGDGSYGWS